MATELGMALAERGHEVHFISYALPMRLEGYRPNIFFHEVDVPTYPLFEYQLYTEALTGKMVDVVTYENLDILHVHYAIPHAVSGYLARQIFKETHHTKLVTTLHGTDVTLIGLEPSLQSLVKFSIEQSDAVTSVSRFLREKTESTFRVNKKIHVIPNFINTAVFNRKESCLRRQVAPNGEFVMVHTSNFRPVKRVTDTIRILKHVVDVLPAKLVLVGDGPDRSEAERLCRELNITEHVRFLGKQSALSEILSAADVFLLPSQSESFGLAALEAMACGVPVVATTTGGITEVVVHGETGYVAEIGDVERMAKYCIDLFTNRKKLEKFSRLSFERADQVFATSLVIPQYEGLYESLLNGEPFEAKEF